LLTSLGRADNIADAAPIGVRNVVGRIIGKEPHSLAGTPRPAPGHAQHFVRVRGVSCRWPRLRIQLCTGVGRRNPPPAM